MTEAQPTTLADFLLARIAEDESFANGWGPNVTDEQLRNALILGGEPAAHWTVTRALAECRFKRDLIETAMEPPTPEGDDWSSGAAGEHEAWRAFVLHQMGKLYSDHPDYRAEWRA